MLIVALDVADSVSVFNPDEESFQLIDMTTQLSSDFKFAGAAPAANGMIIVAPDFADSVGGFDPGDESVQLIDTSTQLIITLKLVSAAPAAIGKIIFAPGFVVMWGTSTSSSTCQRS